MIIVQPGPVYQVNDDDDERYDDDKKRRHAKPDYFLFWISAFHVHSFTQNPKWELHQKSSFRQNIQQLIFLPSSYSS